MLHRTFRLGIFVFAVHLALAGCKSTAAYKSFAAVGVAYATAVDSMLANAGEVTIDTNSEALLADRSLLSDPVALAPSLTKIPATSALGILGVCV